MLWLVKSQKKLLKKKLLHRVGFWNNVLLRSSTFSSLNPSLHGAVEGDHKSRVVPEYTVKNLTRTFVHTLFGFGNTCTVESNLSLLLRLRRMIMGRTILTERVSSEIFPESSFTATAVELPILTSKNIVRRPKYVDVKRLFLPSCDT